LRSCAILRRLFLMHVVSGNGIEFVWVCQTIGIGLWRVLRRLTKLLNECAKSNSISFVVFGCGASIAAD